MKSFSIISVAIERKPGTVQIHTIDVLFNSRGDSRDRRVCDGVCSGSSMASSMPLVDSPRNSRHNPDTCDPFVAMERDCSLFVWRSRVLGGSASHNEDD